MAKLTKRVVDRTRPGPKDQFLWDDELPGFGLRVYPSGRKHFVVQWKRAGRNRRLVLGLYGPITPDEARQLARDALAAIGRGEDPAEARDRRKADLTVAELCDRWVAAGCPRARPDARSGPKLKPGTAATYRSAIERHIKPLLGARKLATLRPPDLETFQASVSAGKSAATEKTGPRGVARVRGGSGIAGRVTSYLAAILAWGRRMGLLSGNPADGVRIIQARKRERILSEDELARLGAALAKAEADGASSLHVKALRILALTGARHNEIAGLQWSEIDQAGFLRLRDSKTGAKVIPLPAAALKILMTVKRRGGSPWVFPASRGDGPMRSLGPFWRALRLTAALPADVVPHTLRHTLASAAAAGGASAPLLMAVLGHADIRTSMKYVHAQLDPAAAVAEAASARIAAALAKRP
jgi:integrase